LAKVGRAIAKRICVRGFNSGNGLILEPTPAQPEDAVRELKVEVDWPLRALNAAIPDTTLVPTELLEITLFMLRC